ncbi:MAG: hypothetical protein H6822_08955 [Planctomycetaceae bacterium]|nr:hypothetical protein [Planctomycetaceae bacterium]
MSATTVTRTETCGAYDCLKRFEVDSDKKADYLVQVKAPSGSWFAIAFCPACMKKWEPATTE